MKGAVLVVPACEQGMGGGHLGRSLFLFQALRERGRDTYLWIPEYCKDDVVLRFREFFESFDRYRNSDPDENSPLLSKREELSGRSWDFIVLDRFRTPTKEFIFWSNLAPLIGIDEGGPCRNRFDFLIDLLPALAGPVPNLTAPSLLPLPRSRRPAGKTASSPLRQPAPEAEVPLRILVSFGAEDAAGLGFSAARTLVEASLKKPGVNRPEITLIAPVPERDDFQRELWKRGSVRIIRKLPELREHFSEYDLLITHFGLGAFEAVYARLPVLLLSPTAYHEKLSRNAGFFSLGSGAAALRRLGKLNFNGELLKTLGQRRAETASRFGLEAEQKEDLGSFMYGLAPRVPENCPVCNDKTAPDGTPAIARFPGETYRRCKRCGAIYLGRLNAPAVEYEREYFFNFYRKQYGKTYLEDFPNLVEMSRKRLARIQALMNQREAGKPSLLDIGCAYGPFLAAAAERGFSPLGLEPAEDAVRYIKEELKLPVLRGFFPLPGDEGKNAGAEGLGEMVKEGGFDAVTLWYVIEHFEEPGKVLGEINRLLKDGGVLAFSTPSFSGISGRKDTRSFLKNSPPDHWTIWSPRVCKKVFQQYGFSLRKTVVSGHHPERFPLLGRFVSPSKKGPLYRLLFFLSRLFRLGDTFEAYGVKRASR